jgi:hypothetical protein
MEALGDLLLVAGDTANNHAVAMTAVNRLAPKFGHVVTLDGNHESYSNGKKLTVLRIPYEMEKLAVENVSVLTPTTPPLKVGDYYIIGENGWYAGFLEHPWEDQHQFWQQCMNDDSCCGITRQGMLPPQLAQAAAARVSDKLATVKAAGGKAIVMTHTAPSEKSVIWKADRYWNRANGFYFNHFMQGVLDEFTDVVPAWVHGHVHQQTEYVYKNTYVVANPRGYTGENPSWKFRELVLNN